MRDDYDRPDQHPDESEFSVLGKPVVCPHCDYGRFRPGRAQLNTPGLTLLGLDWANRTAAVLICARCGHIEWFMSNPDQL